MFAGYILGGVMVVVFCKKETLLFIRDMNEPVMVIQIALLTHDYNYCIRT